MKKKTQEQTEDKLKLTRRWYMDLDSDLVIKNLIFTTLFITMIVCIFNYIMLPYIRDYKITFNENNKQKVIYQTIQKRFNSTQGQFVLTERQNKKQLDMLKADITTQNLQQFLEKYFKKVVIKNQTNEKNLEKQLISTKFQVEVIAKDLKSLQNFFAALKEYDVDLKILIPFMIKKQDDGLFISFGLENQKTFYKMLH